MIYSRLKFLTISTAKTSKYSTFKHHKNNKITPQNNNSLSKPWKIHFPRICNENKIKEKRKKLHLASPLVFILFYNIEQHFNLAFFVYAIGETERERKREQEHHVSFNCPLVVFDLACGQQSATKKNYRSFVVVFVWLTIRRFFCMSTISCKSEMSWLRSKTCERSWRFASRKRLSWSSFWMFCEC